MIQVTNLTKRFQDFTALEHVTCHIGSGCIYGMVGSNGAGKSTFYGHSAVYINRMTDRC